MRNLFFILCVLILGSCSMQNYCTEHYPPKEFTVIDTVVKLQKYFDTIYVVKNDVIIDTVLSIPENVDFHEKKKKNGLTAQIDISKGRLTFKCSEDSLRFIIEKQRRELHITKEESKTILANCNKPHKNAWNYFCTGFFWLIAALSVISIVIILK